MIDNFFILIKFIFCLPWVVPMYLRSKKDRGVHLYGIKGFCGDRGAGKTISLVKMLQDYRKEYGDSIYIITNFGYKDQDFAFMGPDDLLKTYDRTVVFAYDEIQTDLASRNWKGINPSLLSFITQMRKGHGVQLLYTTQRLHMIDKWFRDMTDEFHDCKTFMETFTFAKVYKRLDYFDLNNKVDGNLRSKIKPIYSYSFLQTQEMRDSYDSYQLLDDVKKKEYMDREEMKKIYGDDYMSQ